MSINAVAIRSKATKVARIFDILATVVLVLGGLGVAVFAVTGLVGLFSGDEPVATLFMALVGAAGVAIYTALTWAGITLATIIAGYIAERSSEAQHPGMYQG